MEFHKKYFDKLYRLIVCWNDDDVILTTLKCGQTYVSQFYNTLSFDVAINTDNEVSSLCTSDFKFILTDGVVDVMFHDLGISHISELWSKLNHKIVVRHPFDRFYSGIAEVAHSFIDKPSRDHNFSWTIPIVFKAAGIEDLGKNLRDSGFINYEQIPKDSYNALLTSVIEGAYESIIMSDVHLLQWLQFVEYIRNDKSKLIDINDISEHISTKFPRVSNPNLNKINSKHDIYKSWQKEFHPATRYLDKYQKVYQAEYLAFNRLKQWMNQRKF